MNNLRIETYTYYGQVIREVCYMKFLKKHKIFSFAFFSFIILSGANFFLIYELIKLGMKI